jgi:hypothetical protein
MKCLIVKHPYIDELLDGTKPIEFRTRPTNIRGRIGLVASGERGLVQGTIELFDCTSGAETKWGGWQWHVRNPVRFETPVKFDHPTGPVTWVNADSL